MTIDGDSVWISLILFFLGFASAEISGLVRHRRETSWDAKARREERNARNRQIRDDFQLKALVELQDAVARLLRATERIQWARRQASWSSKEWPTTPDAIKDGTKLDEEFFGALEEISRFSVRVKGVGPGNFAGTVVWDCKKSMDAHNESKSFDAVRSARKRFDEFNRLVGDMMTHLWEEEDPVARGSKRRFRWIGFGRGDSRSA